MADLGMFTPRGAGGGSGQGFSAPYGSAMPSPAPMPAGSAMGSYGGGASAAPRMAAAPAMNGGDMMPPRMSAPAPPVQSTMAPTPTLGQNGFGVHPNVSHDDIVNYLLPKFKNVESGKPEGNYTAKNPNGSASGAYGYIDSTWNHHRGYPRAMDAPPEVQDERMKQDLTQSLSRFGGDPFKVVANHYYPKYASDPTKWSQPIVNSYGKPIPNAPTVKDYLAKVLPADRVDQYMKGVNTDG